jgi:iron complex outermembrane receptor protein
MIEKLLSKSVRLACLGGVAVSVGLVSQGAFAQEASSGADVQRVEITGSSIKRIAKEGALPVQTLSRKDIEQIGAQSVVDLIVALPAFKVISLHLRP